MTQPSLDLALAALPADSRFVPLLRDLTSDDPAILEAANRAASPYKPEETWEDLRTPNWAVSEPEALGLLRAVELFEFPAPPKDRYWWDGIADLIGLLWRSPHPTLVPVAVRAYPNANTWKRQCAILTLFGTVATREAAEAFMACVEKHGWPDPVHGRLFSELQKLLAYPEVMLPGVVLTAHKRIVPFVGEAVLGAVYSGRLDMSTAGDHLEALAPFVLQSVKKALKSVAKHQEQTGIAWRFAEKYEAKRLNAAVLLDLAGRLRSPKLSAPLNEAVRYTDPRLVTFALLALINRGEPYPPEALESAAASHEMRNPLLFGLQALGREELFPSAWKTWEAFGAAAMVDWLAYPAELGREPDEIHLEHTEWLDEERTTVMYVWKFRVEGDPWLAGVSGPHLLEGEPKPVHGSDTFSRFEEWDTATPQEHLERCVGTVEEIAGLDEDEGEE